MAGPCEGGSDRSRYINVAECLLWQFVTEAVQASAMLVRASELTSVAPASCGGAAVRWYSCPLQIAHADILGWD